MFELTHIYQIRYKQEPSFSKLDKELIKELKKDHDHPNYYKRIKKIFGRAPDSYIQAKNAFF